MQFIHHDDSDYVCDQIHEDEFRYKGNDGVEHWKTRIRIWFVGMWNVIQNNIAQDEKKRNTLFQCSQLHRRINHHFALNFKRRPMMTVKLKLFLMIPSFEIIIMMMMIMMMMMMMINMMMIMIMMMMIMMMMMRNHEFIKWFIFIK